MYRAPSDQLIRPSIAIPLHPRILISRTDMNDNNVSYTMASSKWRRSGFVEVVSIHGTPIASFPLSFLVSCGDNTWQYIHYAVNLVIEVDDPHRAGDIVNAEDLPVNPQDAPIAGEFRYVEQGTSTKFLAAGEFLMPWNRQRQRHYPCART